jgi:hypothetical protein
VWVAHLKTPALSGEDIHRMVENPKTATDEHLHSRIALYELVGYDRRGVTLRGRYENAPRFFAPWNAIVRIQGRQEADMPAGE